MLHIVNEKRKHLYQSEKCVLYNKVLARIDI